MIAYVALSLHFPGFSSVQEGDLTQYFYSIITPLYNAITKIVQLYTQDNAMAKRVKLQPCHYAMTKRVKQWQWY